MFLVLLPVLLVVKGSGVGGSLALEPLLLGKGLSGDDLSGESKQIGKQLRPLRKSGLTGCLAAVRAAWFCGWVKKVGV